MGALTLWRDTYRNSDRLKNDDGAWAGEPEGAGDGSPDNTRGTAWARGEGAYEGLSLVMHLSVIPGLGEHEVVAGSSLGSRRHCHSRRADHFEGGER